MNEHWLTTNSHWLDKKSKHGMSDYFWKHKYPCLLEATGHSEEEIEKLINESRIERIS